MAFRSILVNVEPGPAPTALGAAIGLARTFDAQLIGLAADEMSLALSGIDAAAAAAEFYAVERTEIEARLKEAEAKFRAAIPAGLRSEWRSYIDSPTRALVDAARAADLVVVGSRAGDDETFRRIDLGELVLSAGRPVLALASGAAEVKTDRIVIGWKDTREARRAVSDALPFLTRAKSVIAVTLSEGEQARETAALDDLVAWLGRHAVSATGEVLDSGDGFIDILESAARARGATMLVAGGYGHSRLREWLLGGVTRNVIRASDLTRLLSN